MFLHAFAMLKCCIDRVKPQFDMYCDADLSDKDKEA